LVSGLGNLVTKEVKEMLRDPKILLSMVLMPLVVFPAMGAAMNISTTAVEEAVKEVSMALSMALIDNDHGLIAENLVSSLEAMNVTVIEMKGTTVNEALETLQESNVTTLVVIPLGFSQNLTSGQRGELEVYSIFKSIGLSEGMKASAATAPISIYESLMVNRAIQQVFPGIEPGTILDPIAMKNLVVFKGRIVGVPPNVLANMFMSQSLGFTMVIMMLLILAMQTAATSISVEKEEKTLETLLTLPMERLSILTGKLAGSVIVAAAGAVASIIGVNYYTSSVFSLVPTEGADMEALGLVLSPIAYVLLGVMMFVTIVSALAIAICVAAFSENVRSAQSVVGILSTLLTIPTFVLMFADIDILPPAFQIIMYAIPYTHSIIASKAAFLGDYLTMFRSIAYISLFTVTILYVAAKIFTTEKIVTAKISLKKFRFRKEPN